MLLLAIKDHRDRIEVGYGLEPILPDGFDGSMLRATRPRSSKVLRPALFAAAEANGYSIAAAKGVSLDFGLRPIGCAGARASPDSLPLIVIGYHRFATDRRGGGGGGFFTGMLLGNLLGRGGGGQAGAAEVRRL